MNKIEILYASSFYRFNSIYFSVHIQRIDVTFKYTRLKIFVHDLH